MRKGPYESWYHRFYTRWVSEISSSFLIYTVWAVAPLVGDSHVLVPIIFVLDELWANVNVVVEEALSVLISAAQLETICNLINYPSTELSKGQVGSRKSEVRGGKAEVGGRKQQADSRKSEVGSRKSEVRGRKSEVGSRSSEVRSKRSEVGSRRSRVGRSEVRRRK